MLKPLTVITGIPLNTFSHSETTYMVMTGIQLNRFPYAKTTYDRNRNPINNSTFLATFIFSECCILYMPLNSLDADL